jgi:hypothetical protein
MQMVAPAPTVFGSSEPSSAACTSHRKAAARSTRKFTNGPTAVAEVSQRVAVKRCATSAATWAGDFLRALAAAKQPTARSPSSGLGASTLSSVAATAAASATAAAAAMAIGV